MGKKATRLALKAGVKGGIPEAASTGLMYLCAKKKIHIDLWKKKYQGIFWKSLGFLFICHYFFSFSHEGHDLVPLATPTQSSYGSSRPSDEFNRVVFWPENTGI